ncbi:MAG TPA: regulatory protein RecX [Arachnia sp.]|nr:regulatory protein RecX [Arachnia sp.]HMT86481.1 regulatory protein RecX [Arachnia sp.]
MSSDPREQATPEAASRPAQVELARTVALNQLAVRDRSAAELRRTLARRGVPDEVATEVLERLGDAGLVDDAAFASGLAASRLSYSMRGRHRIRQELAERGVSREEADQVLSQLDPEAELDAARRFAEKRARSMSGLERHVAYRRLAGALARRGFPAGIVEEVLGEVFAQGGSANL